MVWRATRPRPSQTSISRHTHSLELQIPNAPESIQVQMTTDLTGLSIATAITGATAIAVVAVPLWWHTPRPEPATRVLNWLWPETPLLPPSPSAKEPNTIAEISITLPPLNEARRVKTESYIATTIAPKSSLIPQPEPKPEPKPEPDVCSDDGGWKVITHHGRGWRCEYPRRSREHRHSHTQHRHRRRD